jgi:hypothetical protein
MRTFRIIKLLAHIVVFFGFAAAASAGQLSFATMEEGDRVEVTYSSTGCFHDTTFYYEVRRVDGVSVFTQYAITWQQGVPPKIAEKKVLGESRLTKKEIDGLDAFLRFYRGKKEASSTTQSTMLVEYYEGSKRVGVETLHDESGGYGLEGRKDIVQIFELADRFQK